MIPILYEETETEFLHNGIGQLDETLVCEVTESGNEQFDLYLEYPSGGRYMKEIQEFRFVAAKPNDVDDIHSFRIYDIDKETDDSVVRVYAETITNDLGGNLIKDIELLDATPQAAMDLLKSNLELPSNLNFISDITKKADVIWERRNPLNCIVGERGSLVDLFGGEIKRTNDYIYLYDRRGRDRVTTIRPESNLDGLKMKVSTKGLVTKILPYFTHIPEGSETQEPETVYGKMVDSPNINNYPVVVLRAIDFSSDEEVVDEKTLNEKASTYFSSINTDVDKPKVSVDVDLVQLSESPMYRHYAGLETIGMTDTVDVWVEEFDIDVNVKVNTVVYDVLQEKVVQISAGTKSMSLYQSNRNEYQQGLDSMQKYVSNGLDHAVQLAANESNKVFRGSTEPTEGMRKNDVWYQPVGTGGIRLHIYDGTEWKLDKVSADQLTGDLDVQNGDVNLININANNITLNRGRFIELSANELNNNLYITGSMLRYVHSNGSETRMTSSGLFHREGGTNYQTNYLFDITTLTGLNHFPESPRWISLPSIYRGKQFKAVAVLTDAYGMTNSANYAQLAIQRVVCYVDRPNIDYANARVPVVGYVYTRNTVSGVREFWPIQVQILSQF